MGDVCVGRGREGWKSPYETGDWAAWEIMLPWVGSFVALLDVVIVGSLVVLRNEAGENRGG